MADHSGRTLASPQVRVWTPKVPEGQSMEAEALGLVAGKPSWAGQLVIWQEKRRRSEIWVSSLSSLVLVISNLYWL